MTYVTDTHALVFFASGDLDRLSPRGARIFRRAEEGRDRVHIPMICFFELALLAERGRVADWSGIESWHALVRAQPGFAIEALAWDDVREARGLAALVDPFDRLIAGTALRLDAPLITSDDRIRRSALVRTVW